MRGHNICFNVVVWKNVLKLFLLPLLIWSTEDTVSCDADQVLTLVVQLGCNLIHRVTVR